MSEKLKERKSFVDIYKETGEEGFQKCAEWLMLLLVITPILSGLINYVMLLDIPSYDPYLYNDRCMILSNIVYGLITFLFFIYIIGKIRINKWYIEDVIHRIGEREPWLIFWLVLLVWGIFCSLAACDIKHAFIGVTELNSGYISHVFMICVMGCAYLLNDKGRKRVLRLYVIVADFCAIVMLSLEYNIPFFYCFTGYSGCSVFTNSNHYGYYLAVVLVFLAGMFYISCDEMKQSQNKTKAMVYIVSFALNMWAMVINDCMGAFLGVFFALVFLLIFWRIRSGRLRLIHFVPMMVLVIFVYLSYIGVINSLLGTTTGTSLVVLLRDIFNVAGKKEGYEQAGTNRIFLWKQAIAAILKKPVLGYGPDMMYDRWFQPVVNMTPHNEYLECALYMGIPGLIMYLGGLISLFVLRIRKLKELPYFMLVSACSVIAYQISSFFGVRKYHTVVYLFMFLGFIINKSHGEETDNA